MRLLAFLNNIKMALCNTSVAQGFSLIASDTTRNVQTTIEPTALIGTAFSAIGDFLLNLISKFFYLICKFVMQLIDFFEVFSYKLIGINSGKEYQVLDTSSPLLKFLLSKPAIRTFAILLIVAIVILIVFTIAAIVRSEYTMMSNADDNRAAKGRIFRRVVRALASIVLFPVILLAGIMFVNAATASALNAFNVSTNTTVGGTIFISSSYNANNYRNYAANNQRIPILIDFEDPSIYNLNGSANYTSDELYEIYSSFEEKGKSIYNNLAYNSFDSFNNTIYYKNNIIHNKEDYSGYEKFICTPEQYLVLADFIDYALENNLKFCVKAYDDADVSWKYLDNTIYSPETKTINISYQDASNIAGDDNYYNISYQATDFDFNTPIQSTLETISQILSIGDYSDYEFKMLERVNNDINFIDWKTYKTDIKLSDDYKRNPTALDELVLYEYSRNLVNNIFKNYSIENLEAGISDFPVSILHQTRYVPSLKEYVEYNQKFVCLINNSYYLVKEVTVYENGEYKTHYELDSDVLDELEVKFSAVDKISAAAYANLTPEEQGNCVYIDAFGTYVNLETDTIGRAKLYQNFRVLFNDAVADSKYGTTYNSNSSQDLIDNGYLVYVDNLEYVYITGSWTEKLINDLKVIYNDININTLINTEQWLSAFSETYNWQDYISGSSNSTTTFNTSLIHPLGVVLSELFLGNVTAGQYYNSYADYIYSSSYNDSVIKGLFISLLGEDYYKEAYQEYQVFMDIYNCMMSSAIDEIAFYEFFDVVNETNQSVQLYTYKAYLSSVLLSTEVGSYLDKVANSIIDGNNVLDYLFNKETNDKGFVTNITFTPYKELEDTLTNNAGYLNLSVQFILDDFTTAINNLYNDYNAGTPIDLDIFVDNFKTQVVNKTFDISKLSDTLQTKIVEMFILYYNSTNDGLNIKEMEIGVSDSEVINYFSGVYEGYQYGLELLNSFENVKDYWEMQETETGDNYEFLDALTTYMSDNGFARQWAMGTNNSYSKTSLLKSLNSTISNLGKIGQGRYSNSEKEYVMPYALNELDSLIRVYSTELASANLTLGLSGLTDAEIKNKIKNEYMSLDSSVLEKTYKVYTLNETDYLDKTLYPRDCEIAKAEAVYAKIALQAHLNALLNNATIFSRTMAEAEIFKGLVSIDNIANLFLIPSSFNNNSLSVLMYSKICASLSDITKNVKALEELELTEVQAIDFSSAIDLVGSAETLKTEIDNCIAGSSVIATKKNDLWQTVLGASVISDLRANGFNTDLNMLELCFKCEDQTGEVAKTQSQTESLEYLWHSLLEFASQNNSLSDSAAVRNLRGFVKRYVQAQQKLDALNLYNIQYSIQAYVSQVLNSTIIVNVNNRTYPLQVNMSSGKFCEYILGYDKMVEKGYTPIYVEKGYDGILTSYKTIDGAETLIVDDAWAQLRTFLNRYGQACIDVTNKSVFNRLEEGKIDNYTLDLYTVNGYDGNTETYLSKLLAKFLINNMSDSVLSSFIKTTPEAPDYYDYLTNLTINDTVKFRTIIVDLLDYLGLDKEFVARINEVDTETPTWTGFTLTQYKKAAMEVIYNYDAIANDTAYDNQQRYLTLINLLSADWQATDAFYDFSSASGNQNKTISKWDTNIKQTGANGTYEFISFNGQTPDGFYSTYIKPAEADGLKRDNYAVGLLMRLSGLINRNENELVGLKFTQDLSKTVKSEENGDVFIICTYNDADEKYYPFLMVNNHLNSVESNDTITEYKENFISKNGYRMPYTDYYYGDVNAENSEVMAKWYPVIMKGIITDKGLPTTIKSVDGNIEFYRDDVKIVNASNIGLETYYSSTEVVVANANIISITVNAITKLVTGKTLTEIALNNIPRLKLNFDLRFAYGVETNNVETLQNGFAQINYSFNEDSGFAMGNLYDTTKLNWIVLILAVIFICTILWQMVWGLAKRIIQITTLSMISPAVFATIPFNGEEKNKKDWVEKESIYNRWFENIKQETLSIIGYTFALNIFFLLIPIIRNFELFSDVSAFMNQNLTQIYNVNIINLLIQIVMYFCAIGTLSSAPDLFGGMFALSNIASQGSATFKNVKDMTTEVTNVTSGQAIIDAKNKAIGLAQAAIPGYELGAQVASKVRTLGTFVQASKTRKAAKASLIAAGMDNKNAAKLAKQAYKKLMDSRAQDEALRERKRQSYRDAAFGDK